MKIEDRWLPVAIPILRPRVAELERDTSTVIELGTFAERYGLVADDALVTEIERLMSAGYIEGNMMPTFGHVRDTAMASFRLLERSARTVGVWPPDDPYEALLRVIEIRIGEEIDEDARSKLRKVRDTVIDVNKDVGTSVMSGLLVEVARALVR